ncbi:MAG: hypothetical protein K0R38_3244 [Polyangiaceae bacterium]|jgi:hypothetical protein|nr:hypothetical protein [Polyangiaceae bacterium]
MPDSPIDELLESLRAALAARRRDGAVRIERVEAALSSYRRAVEHQLATEFAAEHRLKAPQKVGISVGRAAEELKDAVLALPDVARLLHEAPEVEPASAATSKVPPSKATAATTNLEASARGFPKLRAAFGSQKLVVIGALSRDRSDSVPDGFGEHTEWIDTERDGVHALGNLPQRIRQGRVCALIILDRAVKHKHSEPALAAARDAHVPTAFAGQGGRASLERALTQLEGMLSER